MRPIERLAATLKGRGHFSGRDVARIAEELAWDFPYGMSSAEFDAALSPFLQGLDMANAGGLKARVWRALPDLERALSWEILEEELGGAA